MRYALCALLALTACASAKKRAYDAAMSFVEEYKIVVKTDAGVESQSNVKWGYAEGEGEVLVGVYHIPTGEWKVSIHRTGAVAEGYEMVWDFEKARPRIEKRRLEDAKRVLGDVPAPPSP